MQLNWAASGANLLQVGPVQVRTPELRDPQRKYRLTGQGGTASVRLHQPQPHICFCVCLFVHVVVYSDARVCVFCITSTAVSPCSDRLPKLGGPKKAHKRRDPTNHGFWYPPCNGTESQNIGSLSLCSLWGTRAHEQRPQVARPPAPRYPRRCLHVMDLWALCSVVLHILL